jgi:predicted  nucleic acid-binding Zn-ribbon protein
MAKAQLSERTADCAGRLAELERERARASEVVPARERRIFDKVASDCEGEVMAEIEEVDRRHREYACSSCRMEIPFASVATLMSNPNMLVQCTACTRILFLAETTKEVLRK